MKINLLDCLPAPLDGSPKRMLPKQEAFFFSVMDPKGPKFVLYAGGVGSAKTTIGCLTVLSLAITYPGDYLVCRQFLPELKLTTYKQFLEMCPKELIEEHRIADGIVKIKTAVPNKYSWVIFRGLDEPDKHRSLNLNAAYIDESAQVSKEAFLLLQSRLRGPHVRKIFMTTNPAGHDWQYHMFVKQDVFEHPSVKKQFLLVHAPSTENVFLPEGYVKSMLETYSEDRIKREIYADFSAFQGQVYGEFRNDTHVIRPFAIPSDWPRYVGIDHGFRNPAAWLWAAEDYDGNLYVYREFYRSEWLIEQICKTGKGQTSFKDWLPSAYEMMKGERIVWAKIDPSTKARRNEKDGVKLSDFDLYIENLPEDFPLTVANNDVTAGIDRVKSWLKPDDKTGKPRLFVFNTCVNLINELQSYRYPELTAAQTGKKNEKENPIKYQDHACDALRYLIMGLPDPAEKIEDPYAKIVYNSLEGNLLRDLQGIRGAKQSDPFGD